MTRAGLTYRFGPLERRGLLGPVTLSQATTLLAGGLAAIVGVDVDPTPTGALAGLVAFCAAGALALAPVGRRSAVEWLPTSAGFVARRLAASQLSARCARRGSAERGWLPGGVSIGSAPYRDGEIGVLFEARGRRLTAVLACRVLAFSLLDGESRERRLARWGLVLAGAAGGAVRRLQWIERTAPAHGDELERWLEEERDPAIPPSGAPIAESYRELIGSATRVAQEHEILLAVQVDARRVREGGRESAVRVLVEQVERVAQSLDAAEVRVLGALTPPHLAGALAHFRDPYGDGSGARPDPGGPESVTAEAVPPPAREHWDHLDAGAALHTTYWISGWPRVEVSARFMEALLGRAGVVRTVAVTFEPVAPERSTREAEAAITRDRADRELRHRFGQSETARQRQAAEAAARREAELAAGHGEVRFAGFITVSGRDRTELRRACAEVKEHAARARLDLHRMYGQQAAAFTFTLPLCRGLR